MDSKEDLNNQNSWCVWFFGATTPQKHTKAYLCQWKCWTDGARTRTDGATSSLLCNGPTDQLEWPKPDTPSADKTRGLLRFVHNRSFGWCVQEKTEISGSNSKVSYWAVLMSNTGSEILAIVRNNISYAQNQFCVQTSLYIIVFLLSPDCR